MANIEKIRSIVEKDFVQLIKTVFGTNLGAITLYGSYVKERFNPGVSDVNVLVTLSTVDPKAVRRLGTEGRRLIKRGRITPLVLSKDEFLTSADVFPMEYLDIVQHHRVLHGDDPTTGLKIDNTNLRHEIEHQHAVGAVAQPSEIRIPQIEGAADEERREEQQENGKPNVEDQVECDPGDEPEALILRSCQGAQDVPRQPAVR